jgi:membrane-associated phospholipid phosphatase
LEKGCPRYTVEESRYRINKQLRLAVRRRTPIEGDVEQRSDAKSDSHSSRILVVLPAIFVAILLVFFLAYGVIPGPEIIILCFFIYAAYHKWSHRFIRDWIPLVSIFLSYEAMDSIVGSLQKTVHVKQPIALELQLFGSIPTLVLQQFYRSPFLDYLGAFFYSLHFIAPVVFAFLLWKYYPGNYQKFVLALAIGTYSALITFLVYPVAPPWYGLTSAQGWNGVQAIRILVHIDQTLGVPFYRTIFDFVSSNQFAAFPSLHSMYAWLIALYALKVKKTRALPILLLPAGVWFSVVYLGEHYVVDVIGAVIYGTCAFFLAEKLTPLLKGR